MSAIIVKQGVYIQNVYGPFATTIEATVAAYDLAQQDRDDYHSYDVYKESLTGIADDNFVACYRKAKEEKKND